MSKQKKGGIIKNFRLTLVDDDTHDKVWSKKFTRIGAFVTAVTVIVVTIATIFCVIAFTPIRTLIPGYPDARSKHDAIKNAITIDFLENVLTKWELYSENLRRVVDGQEPLKIDSLMEVRKNPAAEAGDFRELAEKNSLLRKEVADEDRFDIKPGSARTLPIEGMHFFTPLKGVVSQGYDKALHPYIDITAPGNSVVMSVLDGTVISAGWNDTEGYTIRISTKETSSPSTSTTRSCSRRPGTKSPAGTPIAVLGGTGSRPTVTIFILSFGTKARPSIRQSI